MTKTQTLTPAFQKEPYTEAREVAPDLGAQYAETGAQTFTFSRFNRINDNTPKPVRLDWRQVCELLSPHAIRDEKDGPLLSGASYPPGATRGNAGVSFVSLAILDFDGGAPLDAIEAGVSGLNNGAGTAAFIYSTHSHNPGAGAFKYRLVLPLLEPVPASQWPDIWRRLSLAFEGAPDRAAKDAARVHYLPSCPATRQDDAVALEWSGGAFDVRTLPTLPIEAPSVPYIAPETRGGDAYARAAFDREIERLCATASNRNDTLNKTARRLGQFIGAGRLDRNEVESALLNASRANGYTAKDGETETRRTMKSGLDAGEPEPNLKGIPKERAPRVRHIPEEQRTQSASDRAPSDAQHSNSTAPSFALTDTGNAERFAARHSDRARFCWEWNTWLAWDGKRWTRDAGAEVERLAKATARGIYAEAATQPDDSARAELVKHAKRSESRKGRADFLALARSEEGIPIQPEELDAAPQLVNLLNGTFDLDAEEFREHRRGDMLTRLFPVAFDPNATAPTWEAALAQWLPDTATRDFVQDAAGASLSGLAYDEFWMFLFGDGANGKSTFTRVLEWLFGDYGHKAQAETFMDCGRDRDRGKPAPELLSMQGKRLVTVQETAQRHRLNEALIKDLTGRDTITARGIQAKNETTFAPQFTLWMFGNHKPQISDTSAGTWRRIRLIPFTQTIPEEGRDPQLSDKLRAELPGILNWALEGLARVMARGFVIPDAVKAATEQYRAENDALAGFLASCCDSSETAFVPSGNLWEAWKTYCQETGEKEGTAKTLGRALKDKGFKDSRPYISGRQTRVWNGLRLKPQEG